MSEETEAVRYYPPRQALWAARKARLMLLWERGSEACEDKPLLRLDELLEAFPRDPVAFPELTPEDMSLLFRPLRRALLESRGCLSENEADALICLVWRCEKEENS